MSTRAEVGVTINSIPRHFLLDSEMFETARADLGEWMRVADVEAVFTPGVAYMPVPRCGHCGWWKSFDPDLQPATVGGIVEQLGAEGWGEALKQIVLPVLGDCTLFECREKQQVHEDSKVIISRTGSGEATVITQADFGCVQFEAKA